jgi:hypothetical protein
LKFVTPSQNNPYWSAHLFLAHVALLLDPHLASVKSIRVLDESSPGVLSESTTVSPVPGAFKFNLTTEFSLVYIVPTLDDEGVGGITHAFVLASDNLHKSGQEDAAGGYVVLDPV